MAIRKVQGQLIFERQVNGQNKPLHHMRVELWDSDPIGADFLGASESGIDGKFEIEYTPSSGGFLDVPDLMIRVKRRDFTYDKGKPITHYTTALTTPTVRNVADDIYDFGIILVGYWEYEEARNSTPLHPVAAFTPRVHTVAGEVPEDQTFGRKLAMAPAIAPILPVHLAHRAINKLNSDKPSEESITEDYPKNKILENEELGSSDSYMVDFVLNGHNPQVLKKNEAGEFYSAFAFNGVEQDGRHFAPNTTAYFKQQGDLLILDRIVVQKRKFNNPDADAEYDGPVTFTKNEPAWERVKRIYRVNYFVFGEGITHLGGTHLNVEQYIIPMKRNIHRSPISRLMFPHFEGTASINFGANSLLVGKDGLVAKGSALTPQSVAALVASTFNQNNWYGWHPRSVVAENHQYAQVAQIYWQVVTDYVDWYFQKNEAEIKDNWVEIRLMSEELVAHSLPYTDQDDDAWVDTNEINTSDKPHPEVQGEIKSISPITGSDECDEEGWNNLKQVCRYLIFAATLRHAWVNDSQYDIGGYIRFASLGLVADITDMNVDEDAAIPADEGLLQPFITRLLTKTEYGYILTDEENDMHPKLKEFLAERQADFKDLGYDIRNIRSTINI